MTDKIKLLPDSVANQIAAGEVVNRPASVVKEMMENAVDAKATNITVNFKEGGKTLIQIIDDGVGMTLNDARMAFERHATSKINQVEDIYAIHTFGFRGEALASIASVAEVELRTKIHDDQLGSKIEISGGKFISQSPVNCPTGSQFIIKNLFYNVPARRRFLDKSSTEARHIIAEYQRVALCYPEIAFSLYDSDSLISKLPASNLRQRIIGVIGKNIGKNLLEISADTSIVRIEGFAGRPASAKQNNKEQFLFVNGRYFKSPYLHKAVVTAYEKLIPANTQPSYFIYLTIDPDRIDVNVHPQKTEIKFSDGNDMWQIINAAIRETLAKSGAVPAMDFEMDPDIEIPVFRETTVFKTPGISANPEFNPFEKYKDIDNDTSYANTKTYSGKSAYGGKNITGSEHLPDNVDFEPTDFESEYEKSILEYITENETQTQLDLGTETGFKGILKWGKRYFATTFEGSLTIIDIPRAYEAILFDRYLTMLTNESCLCQQLLFPHRIAMSIDDMSMLKEHADQFRSFGFDMVFAGEQAIELTGLPADLSTAQPEDLLYELLDTLRDGAGDSSEIKNRKIAQAMAKIGSATKTNINTEKELEMLMAQLTECSNPSFTPSGKPVISMLTDDDIRKKMN